MAIISFDLKNLPRESLSNDCKVLNALTANDGVVSVIAKSTRLFDVCNAFVDALHNTNAANTSAIDMAILNLISQGGIPRIPELAEGEILEFIQKIAFAYSSTARLTILSTIHRVNPITVSRLEMYTGIANQTLRRHLKTLVACRLISRTRVGQTFLYDKMSHRLSTMIYLYNALFYPNSTKHDEMSDEDLYDFGSLL